MNIIWKRPDGGVSVTHLTPEALAAMERGSVLAPLVARRASIIAALNAATLELDRLNAQIVPDEEPAPALIEAQSAAASVIAQAQAELARIDEYDTIVETIGLSLADHAALLQARAQAHWNEALELDLAAPTPEILEWIVVAEAIDLPPTREWRGAWTWTTDDPVIDICPVTAVEITKDRLRRERAPLLAALDVAYMRALESGNPAAVVAEKQRLRDITAQADLCAPGDLAALSALTCT